MIAADERSINIQEYLNARHQQMNDKSVKSLVGHYVSACNSLGNVFYGKRQLNEELEIFDLIYEDQNVNNLLVTCLLKNLGDHILNHSYWLCNMFDDALSYQFKALNKQQRISYGEQSQTFLSLENTGSLYYNLQK
ncbi:hypothetical protein I4U23_027542 [Adineta vaga]|nr:hypothetical protein I4U23_027542 [Adineta vaga]